MHRPDLLSQDISMCGQSEGVLHPLPQILKSELVKLKDAARRFLQETTAAQSWPVMQTQPIQYDSTKLCCNKQEKGLLDQHFPTAKQSVFYIILSLTSHLLQKLFYTLHY